jgi:hypothetical protein
MEFNFSLESMTAVTAAITMEILNMIGLLSAELKKSLKNKVPVIETIKVTDNTI